MKMSGVTISLSPQSLLPTSPPRCFPLPSPSPALTRVSPLLQQPLRSSRLRIQCNCSSSPGGPGPGPGENGSREVLDAFFLGKAVADTLTERIESTVGEFLSTIGRLQAEQQKQVQEFQEEVFERAKKAKEKAAREAMEEQGLAPTSTTMNPSNTVVSDPSSINGLVNSEGDDESTDNDPLSGVSIDE